MIFFIMESYFVKIITDSIIIFLPLSVTVGHFIERQNGRCVKYNRPSVESARRRQKLLFQVEERDSATAIRSRHTSCCTRKGCSERHC